MRPNAKLHNWKKSFALATLFVAPIMLLMSCLPMIPERETIVPAETSTKSIPASLSATPTARDFDRHTGCGGVDELGHIFFLKPSYYGNRRHASNFDLYVMNGNGCFPRLVMKRVSGSPAWSKDGKRLAVGCENNTYLCILDVKATLSRCSGMEEESAGTCEPTILQKFTLPSDIGEENYFNNIAWSKDGDKIAVEAGNPDGKYTLSILFLEGGWKSIFRESGAYNVDWSPQKDLLVQNGLSLVDTNSVRQTTIIRQGMYPAWSKDGERIAFRKPGADQSIEPWGIAEFNVSEKAWEWLYEPVPWDDRQRWGQNLVIRDDGHHRTISWSPDEKFIAFVALYRHNYDSQIFRLNIESGKVDVLTTHLVTREGDGYFFAPAWGP